MGKFNFLSCNREIMFDNCTAKRPFIASELAFTIISSTLVGRDAHATETGFGQEGTGSK